MKKKYLDGSYWEFTESFNYQLHKVDEGGYKGWVSVITDTVAKYPLMVDYEVSAKKVFDDGYTCIVFLPEKGKWSMTAIYDTEGLIVEWYIDIIKSWGISGDGLPYFFDLYLDVVIRPDYTSVMIDQDELQEALDEGIIDSEDFDLAYTHAKEVMATVVRDRRLLDEFIHWRKWLS